jgi:hypothetical protein
MEEFKNMKLFPAAIHGCAGGLVMLACSHQLAFAANAGKDVSEEIDAPRSSARYVELHIITGDVSFRSDLDEAGVIRLGCHFRATDQADIAGLIDVVAQARLTQKTRPLYDYDPRVVVRIYQDSQRYASIVMSMDYDNAAAQGLYRHDDGTDGVPVEAKNGIHKELRFWASQHGSLAMKPCRLLPDNAPSNSVHGAEHA